MIYADEYRSIKKVLKKELDHERYQHTLGVAYTAQCLAMRYGEDLGRAYLAGLLHDCAKSIPRDGRLMLCEEWDIPIKEVEERNTSLLHAKMGAYLARKKFGVNDPEILSAIECHTVGKEAMTQFEKIIFTADYIEPCRDKADNLEEIRKTAFLDLDLAVLLILRGTLDYLEVSGNTDIDPDTVIVYEYYRKLIDERVKA